MRVSRHGTIFRTSSPARYRSDRLEYVAYSQQPDPFAVNPIRRSAFLVGASALAFFGPLVLGGQNGALAIIAGGWLGLIGLALGIPVLLLSLGEEIYRRLSEELRPTVARLELSPRVRHILLRHGYTTVVSVEDTPDSVLLLLSNMESRDVREVRRAISLWRYRDWQERGFP